MITTDTVCRDYLKLCLPRSWEDAVATTRELLAKVEFLTWHGRAEILDNHLWSRARSCLNHQNMTALVNRQAALYTSAAAIGELEAETRSTITAVLMALNERTRVESDAQALTLLLARDPKYQHAAHAWIETRGEASVRETLRDLPGYAITLLAANPDDSLESFMARDAIRYTMFGD